MWRLSKLKRCRCKLYLKCVFYRLFSGLGHSFWFRPFFRPRKRLLSSTWVSWSGRWWGSLLISGSRAHRGGASRRRACASRWRVWGTFLPVPAFPCSIYLRFRGSHHLFPWFRPLISLTALLSCLCPCRPSLCCRRALISDLSRNVLIINHCRL